MLIAHISDTHGSKCEIPDADILIHTGDIIPGRGYLQDLHKFEAWMKELPHKYKIFVPGNHDGIVGLFRNEIKDILSSVHVLIDELIVIEGVSIWGTPWSLPFGNWYFMKNEWQLQELYSKIPEGTHIIASHGPPHGTCDLVDGMNVGSLALRETILRVYPKAVLCGHIHEGYGKDYVHGVPVYNSSHLNEVYVPLNNAQLIEI